jgi:outer membrane protein assembly factor BamB
MRYIAVILLLFISAAASAAEQWTPRPGDCLEYRGANRDGVVKSVRIETDWEANPPKELWRRKAGPSWSGLIVVAGHVVTQEQRGEAEVVVCHDAATGDEVWVHEDKVRFEESMSGEGPRSTPTFADGRIYTLGGNGTLNCLDAATGDVVWAHDIVADAGLKPSDVPQWGYSNSPLVVDGLVIVFAGGEAKSVLAYRADDGELAWSSAGGKQSYSSPQLVTLAGRRQILMHDSHSLRGIDIADGTVLWEHPSSNKESMPILQPHQLAESNELVVVTEAGVELLEVSLEKDKWSVESVWRTNQFRANFNDFVIHDGYLYGLDDGIACAIDLATGERVWKKGRLGFGQLLLLPEQDILLVSSNKGEFVLVAAKPTAFEEIARFQAIEGKTWNGPVIDGAGRIFVRNGEEIAAFQLDLETAAPQAATAGIAD